MISSPFWEGFESKWGTPKDPARSLKIILRPDVSTHRFPRSYFIMGRRTESESRAFKKKIVRLRERGESIIGIAERLQISKQYVSLVLIEASGRHRSVNIKSGPKTPSDVNEQMQTTVAQIEEQGEYTMAEFLRVIAERRKAALASKRSKKQCAC